MRERMDWWDWWVNRILPAETGTGTEREMWKDAAPGSEECVRMSGRGKRRERQEGLEDTKKKEAPAYGPERARCRWDLLIKNGGGLLSRPYGQYHRRWRA